MSALADVTSAVRPPEPIVARLPISLGQFLKLAGLASTGGDAKQLVASGLVRVNSVVETRRGRKLGLGDVVDTGGASAQVVAAGGGSGPPQPVRE